MDCQEFMNNFLNQLELLNQKLNVVSLNTVSIDELNENIKILTKLLAGFTASDD